MNKAGRLRQAGLACFGAGRAPLPRIPIFSRQFSVSLDGPDRVARGDPRAAAGIEALGADNEWKDARSRA